MNLPLLHTWDTNIKLLTATFLIVLSIGFFSGINFVEKTSGFNPKGVQENYLGNEEDENADVLKFKKNDKQLSSLIHSHILSMSVIFFIVALLVSATPINTTLKKFLMIEPLTSVLLTFGGIYFLSKGQLWMKYVIMLSGMLMTLSYGISVSIVLRHLLKKNIEGV